MARDAAPSYDLLDDVMEYRRAVLACPRCRTAWILWSPEPCGQVIDLRSVIWIEDDPDRGCFACPPHANDLTSRQRDHLVRELAETQAIHAMAVEVDRALSEGRTSEHEWHNHNDLAEIERLRGELASHTTVAIADQDVRESMRRVLSTLNEARRIVEMPPVDDLNHRTPDSDP